MIEVVDMDNTELLTFEQEKELAYRAASGDKDARDKLVLANLKLVYDIAGRFLARHNRTVHINQEDLFQVGTIGLMHAIDKFDPDKGYRLSTYATWWIKQALGRYYHENGYSVTFPQYIAEYMPKLQHARNALVKEGLPVSAEQVFELVKDIPQGRVKLTLEMVETMLFWLVPNRSLSFAVDKDEGLELGSILPDPDDAYTSLDDDLDKAALIAEMLSALDEKKRRLIEKHYGLGSYHNREQSLRDIGKELGVTRQAILLMENRSIETMRAVAIKKGIA